MRTMIGGYKQLVVTTAAIATATAVAAIFVLSDGWGCGALASRRGVHLLNTTSSLPLQLGKMDSDLNEHGLQALATATSSALRTVHWPWGVQFARFEGKAGTLGAVLAHPRHYTGAFLLIVPGNTSKHALHRRSKHTPFLSLDPGSSRHLEPWVPLRPLNAAAKAAEATLGRRLFPFRLGTATLLPCRSGSGPCAVWEVASGRVVLDVGLAAKAAGMGQGLASLVSAFADALQPHMRSAAELLAGAGAPPGLPQLAAVFARGAAAAVTLLLAANLPAWWCITCPVVLGMLAPFLFNLGLTSAADALCSHMQLPADTCADLWWGAFALALVLSLGSAVPIVYICRLPDCVKALVGGGNR